MGSLRWVLLGLLAWNLPGIGSGQTQDSEPDPNEVSITTEGFRGHVGGQTTFLLDGSALCYKSGNLNYDLGRATIYSSDKDLFHWTEVPVVLARRDLHFYYVAGGDRERLFFSAQQYDPLGVTRYCLVAFDVQSQTTTKLREIPSQRAAFASHAVGVIATDQGIELTTDGGSTWKSPPALVPEIEQSIKLFKWISPTKLLVAGGNGALLLLELDEKSRFHKVWSTPPQGDLRSLTGFTPAGEYAWINQQVPSGSKLYRLRLADGQLDVPFETDFVPQNVWVYHQHVIVAGVRYTQVPKRLAEYTCSVWIAGPGDSKLQPLPTTWPANDFSLLPLNSPMALVIDHAGKGSVYNLETRELEPAKLQVTTLPDKTMPTREQWNKVRSLASQLSDEQLKVIVNRVDRKSDLTARERAARLIEEAQHVTSACQPGSRSHPTPRGVGRNKRAARQP